MKWICLILALSCLLSACQKAETDLSGEDAARRVCAACGDGTLRRADDDFVTAVLGGTDRVSWAAIYLDTADNGTEVGLLEAVDTVSVPLVKDAVSEYLASERRSVEALAALYPGEELHARLARFDGAIVAQRGLLVYYILADGARRDQILHALTDGT